MAEHPARVSTPGPGSGRPHAQGSLRSLLRRIRDAPATLSRRRQQRGSVVILIRHLDGSGGVCRSVTNLANGLVGAGLEVSLLVLFRRRTPRYQLDPRVRVSYVRSLRPQARARRLPPRQRKLDRRPSRLRGADEEMTALTDRRLRRHLLALGPCTLISHRPALHQAAAKWAPDHVVRLAVEHTAFDLRPPEIRLAVRETLPKLDRLVVLTDENREQWRDYLGSEAKLATIPNAVPFDVGQSLTSWWSPVVIAAGSLIPRKGFDRLIRAFAPLAAEFPEWELRIFGRGPDHEVLSKLIDAEGVGGAVTLAGYSRSLEDEMLASSVFVMSSHSEGLPMVGLEAMSVGLPMVAFDCTGPKQLVAHGSSGLLATDGDIDGLTDALRAVMADESLRRRYGRASHALARSYHTDSVVAQWRALIREVS